MSQGVTAPGGSEQELEEPRWAWAGVWVIIWVINDLGFVRGGCTALCQEKELGIAAGPAGQLWSCHSSVFESFLASVRASTRLSCVLFLHGGCCVCAAPSQREQLGWEFFLGKKPKNNLKPGWFGAVLADLSPRGGTSRALQGSALIAEPHIPPRSCSCSGTIKVTAPHGEKKPGAFPKEPKSIPARDSS